LVGVWRTYTAVASSSIALEKLERAKGFEPSTPTLARSCSTPELHPHPFDIRPSDVGRQGRTYSQKPGPNATVAKRRSIIRGGRPAFSARAGLAGGPPRGALTLPKPRFPPQTL